jgi:anti-anti-sigma factor
MHIHVPAAMDGSGYPATVATDISFRDELGSVIFDLDGPLALRRPTERLCQEVCGLLESGRRNFIFNLTAVPYTDSAGVGALITCHRAIHAAGGELTLVAPHQRVLEMLKRMRVDTFFTFRGDERTALARS